MQQLKDKVRGALAKAGIDASSWPLAVIPITILWFELVFKGTTTGFSWPQTAYIALLALAMGAVGTVLTSLSRLPKVNQWLRFALLLVVGVSFGVEYFVYCEFKMFYDLVTVTSGAGHAASGFSDQIAMLVFTPSGIAHVVAFLTPAALYGFWLRRHDPGARVAIPQLATVGAVAATCCLVVAASASGSPLGRAFTDRYSFQTVVEGFGLLPGVGKELQASLLDSGEATFSTDQPTRSAGVVADAASAEADATANATADKADTEASDSKAEGTKADDSKADTSSKADDAGSASANDKKAASTPAKQEQPVVLDIDFAKLATTTDGTWASLDRYVAAQTPSHTNSMTGRFEGYNLVFISGEAFSAEAIREDVTPTLYRMATKGIQFTDYYQFASAGTTGGEYENIFGMLPTDGGGSVIDTATHNNYLTMGWALNAKGYDGWAFHNNDYTYYSRDLTHNQLGYNHGYMGYGNGMEQWVQPQWPESDLEMVKGTWENLYGEYGDEDHPFNVYYMSVSGHGVYGLGSNDMSAKWWDEVADLPYSEPVKAYIASNIDLDRAMEYLIGQLEERGIADRTVIVIGADHFPYGLDGDGYLGQLPYLSELYGYDVTNLMQRDHNRLIMWCGDLEDDKPIVVSSPTSSLDILPTLLNLFGLEWDSRLLPGRDVFGDRDALAFNLNYDWKTDLGTYFASYDTFEPAEGATVPAGYVEAMNVVVDDKVRYCEAVLDTDYFRHVFGDPEDVDAMNAAGKAAREAEEPDKEELEEGTGRWGEDIVRRFEARYGTEYNSDGTKKGSSKKDSGKKP